MPFADRKQAGQQLGEALSEYADRDVVVLGLPRGGVPVAFQVARALDAPLGVFVVRKLGVPGHAELAMGAIASGGVRVLNKDLLGRLGLSQQVIEHVTERERRELQQREEAYRGARPGVDPGGRTVILVDDGLATGATMRAAVDALRQREAARIVVAVPTAPRGVCTEFKDLVDEVICLETPRAFLGVGGSYRDFSQTSNAKVREYLRRADEFGSGH